MTLEEIVAKFANVLEQFEPIDRKPSDTELMQIQEGVAPLLLQIPYDKTGAMHNLIGLIRLETAYTTRYGAAFLEPTRVGAYYATIDYDSTAVDRAITEAAHKSKRVYRATYKTVQRETAQFILAIVKDTWVRELRDTENLYINATSKVLLAHMQVGCTVRHALDLLALHN